MLRTCLFLFLAATPAFAQVTLLGPVAFPPNATDQSGLKGSIADGVPANALASHGSAIAWTGRDNTFLMLSDRGPLKVDYPTRFHTVEFAIDDDGMPSAAPRCSATTMFTDDKGAPMTGGSAAAGRFDPEGLRVGPDGTVYVCDEYGPAIAAFSPQGKLIKRYPVPEKFLCKAPDAKEDKELPPSNTAGRQPNRGFEGLAISPTGDRVFAVLQSPLLQDGALDDAGKRTGVNLRILELTLADGKTRELVYQLDAPGNCVSEILAVNDHEFLVIERDELAGEQAKVKKIFRADIAPASDVSGVAALPATGLPGGVKPASKSLFIDLLNPKFGNNDDRLPSKIEGLAFGRDLADGSHTLLVTTDNDFDPGEPTWIYIFGFAKKDLPGFQPAAFGPGK